MNIESLFLKLKNSYSKNMPEINAYRKKLYPEFVLSDKVKTIKDEIPVFTFHSVEPEKLEAQLQFLATNGYTTLKANDFFEAIVGGKSVPERSILLTFDDGWRSLWTYAYPLLKKYEMHGICFIIPGFVQEDNQRYLNLEDVWQRKVQPNRLLNRDKGREQTYCTWQEIREMAKEGTIEFQSHTMYHSLIFTSPKIVDFLNPSFDSYVGNHQVPIVRNNGLDNWNQPVSLGMPIYANAPRMGGMRRYFDDEYLRQECIQFVVDRGGQDFFTRKNWKRQLRRCVSNYKEKFGEKGYYESSHELRESIYSDLLESRCLIEKKLPDTRVTHLCYPYYVGSQVAVEASEEAGYLCNHWGFLDGRQSNKKGDNPYYIVRLSEEFIFRLPGDMRKPLCKLMIERINNNYRRFLAITE